MKPTGIIRGDGRGDGRGHGSGSGYIWLLIYCKQKCFLHGFTSTPWAGNLARPHLINPDWLINYFYL